MSKTTYKEKRATPITPYIRLTVEEKGTNKPTKPNPIIPNIPTVKIGAKPLKSYLDWKVKTVKPIKMIEVHNKACKTVVLFSKVEITAPIANDSKNVNKPNKLKFKGCECLFQYVKPSDTNEPMIGMNNTLEFLNINI